MGSTVGENIKERREEKKYTISAVADILHLKHSEVKKIESGELLPDDELLVKFSKLYGCSVDYLEGEVDLQLIEDDLSDVEKLLNQNLNLAKKIIDKLDKEIYKYKKIKQKLNELNFMMGKPTELPIEFEGHKEDITEQFVLLRGVYTFTIIPESPGNITLKLFNPKGDWELIHNSDINSVTKRIVSLDEDNTYILSGENTRINWKVIIDDAFDV